MSVFLDCWRGLGVVGSWIERESEKVARTKLTCTFVFWLRRDVHVKWNQKPDLEFRGGFRQMYEVCLPSGSCALPFEIVGNLSRMVLTRDRTLMILFADCSLAN